MNEELKRYFNGEEMPASVWQGKYQADGEVTPDDMHRRMAKEFAKVEEKYRLNPCTAHDFDTETLSPYGQIRRHLDEERIYSYFKDFRYIIPQGSIMSQLGVDSIGSLSNCFVVGQPVDSYGGIFEKDQELAQLMKRRGGVGIDISTLRPQGTPTSNAAKTSTGAVSFMHRFSNTTREVAQNGRRGALMISIDINHPDVMEFIKIKRDLSQVTGANISIKLNNEFMKAVENDEDYILRFPCDISSEIVDCQKEDLQYNTLDTIIDSSLEHKVYAKKIKAKEYWDEIIKSAHNVAEPGLMFWDNMVNYSPDGVYSQFKQVTTNPCSEIGMQPYDACRLIALNLFSFVDKPFTKAARFDFDKFYRVNYEAMRLSDDLIDLELGHIDRIIDKIKSDPQDLSVKSTELSLWLKVKNTATASRRTGLGFTGLGDALAALGLKYDSDEALNMIENIMDYKLKSELDCTTDLAILRGPFTGFDSDLEAPVLPKDKLGNEFYEFVAKTYPNEFARMQKHGRRNVSWSTVAPTGSLSIMAKAIFETVQFPNISSGMEPIFMPFYMRRKKVNPGEEGVRVDFTDQNGDTWQEYPIVMGAFKLWYQLNAKEGDLDIELLSAEEMQKVYEKSPWYKACAPDIDWVRRVEIQGIIQKYITHSISSTINLPSDVSEEEVSRIYLESWKKGLKGITVYRDGSRSGVLVSSTEVKERDTFDYVDAAKRPKALPCEIHTTVSRGTKWNVIVGLLNDKPYEVFAIPHFTDIKSAELVKVKRGRYDLEVNGETYSEDVTSEMSSEEEVITRLVSTSLRHGASIAFVVDQLRKSYGDITSFNKAIARVLTKHINSETPQTSDNCTECGTELIFEEGCKKCPGCGYTACG